MSKKIRPTDRRRRRTRSGLKKAVVRVQQRDYNGVRG